MDFSLTTRTVSDVLIIEAVGRLTLGVAATSFGDAVSAGFAGERKCVLVNLEGVTYIDSSGIGELLSGLKKAVAAGGGFKVLRVSPRVEGLMRLTGVYPHFSFFRDEAAALASFAFVS